MTREEAINAITQFIENYAYGNDLIGLNMAIETLKKERPHGEWIPKDVHNCWTRFECSVCGYYHQPVHDFGESKPDYNFCPNCGADMREGDSDA